MRYFLIDRVDDFISISLALGTRTLEYSSTDLIAEYSNKEKSRSLPEEINAYI